MDCKALLKEAKNAIKNKDFHGALKLSKSIIKEDRNNYMALVFLGLSLQEVGPVDHSPKAFQKAIDLNPTNPLAWQGLINYHEKLDSKDKTELIKLYSSYLSIETNEAKLLDYSKKLCHINTSGDIVRTLIEISKKCTANIQTQILNLVVDLLELIPDSDKTLDLYELCLTAFLSTPSVPETFYSNYLTLLNKTGDNRKVLEHSVKMHDLYPSSMLALSWICKIFNQMYIEDSPELPCDIMNRVAGYVDKLLEIDPKNTMGIFTQAVLLYKENHLVEAKEKLSEVTTQRPGLVYAWILLTDVLIKLHLIQEAAVCLNKSQKLMRSLSNPKAVAEKVSYQELEILSSSNNVADWEKAVTISDREEFNRSKCLPAIIKVHSNLGRFTDARRYISELEVIDKTLAEFYMFCLYKKQKKYSEAEVMIGQSTCNLTEWWMEVGLLYWELEEYNKSLEPFLKAAKCDPNNYSCFIHLGHYYSKVGQLEKARRCYEKAFKINSLSSEAGSELTKIYRKQKNWEANLNLLTNLTQGLVDGTNIWAWLQLGLTYLEQGNFISAIECLRTVLRIEPENVHCWESLADAYFSKGAFTSALKCYQRATDLSEFSLYSALQVAYIKKILGEYPEAKADFENILSYNSEYVPALKGLSETCLGQAKEYFKEQRLGTARDYAQIAANKVTLAILQRSELACLWKILTDTVLFVARLPEKYSFLKVSQALLGSSKSDESTVLELQELFGFAVKCYCKAVSLAKENPFLWHDLGTCYASYAFYISDSTKKSELFNCALAAAQHSTSLSPENWQHWNLLGNIAILTDPPNYALAQHSFIKAVIAESNSAIAWTNLGILYLLMGDLKLANKAFGEGQRSDPNYVNSWIGQALIAEIMGHSDAMDLFRHSTQLGQHQQGSIGYGNWVCHMLINDQPNDKAVQYNIYNMHAIPVAYDNVSWYTEKNPNSGCAWNMLGILSERMGLLNTAKRAFKHAFVLADKKHKDVARTNYGRLLYRTGEYKSAVEMFANVEEATFSSGGGLALALFRDGQYEESYAAYEQALHWLTEEQTYQSDLLVALASMAYKFQGVDAAKTLLFQSIGLKPPSPWSLYATLSLSLLHNDLKLAQLVLNELLNMETGVNQTGDYVEYIYHYSTLLSYLYILKNDKKEAVAEISKLVHKHPDIASPWLTLSQLILRLEKNKRRLKAGANCASAALKLDQRNMDVSNVLCLSALSYFRAGDLKQATVFAQKAVHYFPNLPDGWATLILLLKTAKKPSVPSTFSVKLQNYFVSINSNERILSWSKKFMG